ncbi:MAG: membrane protein insertion efficiency factor YidD [Candidatus Marinimicrobia bacterium]|nr:membrane protein insertion efficiency factor YidD [Candidatus Neomarinimicrobiota bacterium]
MAKLLIGLVSIYRNTIGLVLPPACRYSPTCSRYMIDSIEKYGSFFGLIKGLKRIGRCHPWSKHNHWDPVK